MGLYPGVGAYIRKIFEYVYRRAYIRGVYSGFYGMYVTERENIRLQLSKSILFVMILST